MQTLHFTDEVSLDEIVEITLKAYFRLKASRRLKRRSIWATVVSTSLLTGLLINGPLHHRLILGGTLFVAMALLYPRFYYSYVERSVRATTLESMGGDGPYEVRYEVDEEFIRLEQAGLNLGFPWAEIVEVELKDQQVYLWSSKSAGLVVRFRSFADAHQKDAFLALVDKLPQQSTNEPEATGS